MVTKSKVYRVSSNRAYKESLNALKECGFEIEDQKRSSIKARSPSSLWSWGEDIEIDLIHRNAGTEVRISSSPTSQFFDWGKSDENVSRLLANLDLRLERIK